MVYDKVGPLAVSAWGLELGLHLFSRGKKTPKQ